MLIIDTNVWIAAHVREEEHYRISRAWFLRAVNSGERIAARRILLVEVAAALERSSKASYRTMIEQRLQTLPIRWATIDDILIERARDIATVLKLRSLDCLYVATAEILNVPLYTWDDEVERRASTRIRVFKPS